MSEDVFQSLVAGDVRLSDLPELSRAELASLYVEITGISSAPARTHEEAVERTRKALQRAFDVKKGINPLRLGGRKPMDLRPRPLAHQAQTFRRGERSAIGRLLELLIDRGSALIDDCLSICGTTAQTRQALAYINRANGYGVKEISGRVYLYFTDPPVPSGGSGAQACILTPDPSRKAPLYAESRQVGRPLRRVHVRRLCGCGSLVASPGGGAAVAASADRERSEGLWAGPDPVGRHRARRLEPGDSGLRGRAREEEPSGDQGACGDDRGPRGDARPSGGAHRVSAEGDREPQADPRLEIEPTFPFPEPFRLKKYHLDRITFLAAKLKTLDFEEVILKALAFYDLAVCAHLDGARLLAHHKDGSKEELKP